MPPVLWTPSSPTFSWVPTIIYFTVSQVCTLYTGYSSLAWRHAQGSHILKNLFLHPEVCLPVATKFVVALTAPFFPTSFLDYLYYLTLQALFSRWDPLCCSQKSAKTVRTESNSSWVLSSSITQQLWDCRHHFSLHFSETTVSSSSPSSLVASSQAAWKALTHLPLNVIIPLSLRGQRLRSKP